jgi:hypothetical protein
LKVRKFINTKFFKRDLSYEQWLKDFIKPLNSNELNQMEKELSNSNSVNNSSFQPLQGAWMNIPPSLILTIVIATATIIKESLNSDNE